MLRTTYEAWKQGKASNDELVQVSYMVMLDHMDAFRAMPLPRPVPEAIAKFRSIPDQDRKAMSEEVKGKLFTRYGDWLSSERRVLTQNYTNKLRLTELKEWALLTKKPQNILDSIEQVLWTHKDSETEEQSELPVDV